jgi:phosphoserine phosphatase
MKLVVFDLDGTLLRGRTVYEHLARKLDHRAIVHRAERSRNHRQILSSRERVHAAYGGRTDVDLMRLMPGITAAPGVATAFERLRSEGVIIAIATLTWSFAARWFCRTYGAHQWLATQRDPRRGLVHVWPRDKAVWVHRLTLRHSLTRSDVAAVGDSASDLPMLRAAGHGYFVGSRLPVDAIGIRHLPAVAIDVLVEEMLRAGRRGGL